MFKNEQFQLSQLFFAAGSPIGRLSSAYNSRALILLLQYLSAGSPPY